MATLKELLEDRKMSPVDLEIYDLTTKSNLLMVVNADETPRAGIIRLAEYLKEKYGIDMAIIFSQQDVDKTLALYAIKEAPIDNPRLT